MLKNTIKLIPPIVACAFAASTVVHAGTPSEPRSEKVSYADLNLANEEGVKTLDRRLNNAIKRVCGYEIGYAQFQSRACVDDTWDISVRPQRDKVIAAARRTPSVQIAASALTISRP